MSVPRRVVAVGGGHGLYRALAAVRLMGLQPTAIVTVADDGGSSGRLRRDHDVIAVGDVRMALLALARNRRLAELLGHRFQHGELEGHALGNLVLLALIERHQGDVVDALRAAGALLACAGQVLPATAASVQLKASISGEEVGGQVRVARASGRVDRVWLEPSAPSAPPEAVAAITEADVVLLGPGSLFTSVIAALLVPELAESLARTAARVVYLGNILTQPGETSQLDAAAHVDALLAHLPGLRLTGVLLHAGPAPDGPGEPLGGIDVPLASERVGATDQPWVRSADVAARGPDGQPLASHDAERLAAALTSIVDEGLLDPDAGRS